MEPVRPGLRRTEEQFKAALNKFGKKPSRGWDSFADFEQKAIRAQARAYKEIWMQLQNGTGESDPKEFVSRVQRIAGAAANHGG